MEKPDGKLIRFGHSVGVILKEKYLYASGMQLGDEVNVVCSKDKITLKKKTKKKEGE